MQILKNSNANSKKISLQFALDLGIKLIQNKNTNFLRIKNGLEFCTWIMVRKLSVIS